MKTNSIQIRALLLFIILNGLAISSAYSQTAGTLTYSAGTSAPISDYGTKHVLAVWFENTANPSVFIKTQAKYGSTDNDDHLTSWTAKSNSNLVDAVSAATLNTYGTITGTWNGTNFGGTVVPDGTYNIYIEMGWGRDHVAAHAVKSFTFTKGTTPEHLTPVGTTNFTNVVIDWTPMATLVGTTESFDNVNVFPNPTTGMVNLNFNRELKGVSIMVTNLSGKTFFSESDVKIPVGTKLLDLSACKNGLYFILIESENIKYNYKILIDR